jgi:hypothetical protein
MAVIDVAITFNGGQCDHSKLMIGIAPDGARGRATASGYEVSHFVASFDGLKNLPAGEYYVDHAECDLHGKHTFKGPLARFQVREGEAVNLGRLRMAFTFDNFWWQTSGKTQRTIEPLPPKTVEWLTKKVPRFYRTVVYRPMTFDAPVANTGNGNKS